MKIFFMLRARCCVPAPPSEITKIKFYRVHHIILDFYSFQHDEAYDEDGY